MSELEPNTPWLRRMRWTARATALLAVGWGLVWVYRSALAGDVSAALAGAGLCLAGLVLEVVSAAVSRLGSLALRSSRRTDALEARLARLSLAMEELDDSVIGEMDLMEGGDHVDELVAAHLDQPMFPRLVAGADSDVAALQTEQQELERLVRRELERLQGQFASLVRSGEYAAALQAGDRIVALFPNSSLAQEFQSVRSHLTRRALDEGPEDESASAI